MENDEGVPCAVIREIAALRKLSIHPNILKLKEVKFSTPCEEDDWIKTPPQVFQFYELAECDLHTFLSKSHKVKGEMKSSVITSFSFQIAHALEFCHRHLIFHRDLKPANILVMPERKIVKLADFGLSRYRSLQPSPFTEDVVTLWYRAPEILLHGNYDESSDMWALGALILEMVDGDPLFAGDSEIDTLFLIWKALGTPTEETWPGITSQHLFQNSFPSFPRKGVDTLTEKELEFEMEDLLSSLLIQDPNNRISSQECLTHPLFHNLSLPSSLVDQYEDLDKSRGVVMNI